MNTVELAYKFIIQDTILKNAHSTMFKKIKKLKNGDVYRLARFGLHNVDNFIWFEVPLILFRTPYYVIC